MDDATELERLERELVEALGRGDGEALARILDDAFVFTDPSGRSLSRDRCLEEIRRGELAFDEAELRSARARVFGETGVVVGSIWLRGRAGEMGYDGEYSFVDVYRKADGRWRAVLSSGDRAAPFVASGDE